MLYLDMSPNDLQQLSVLIRTEANRIASEESFLIDGIRYYKTKALAEKLDINHRTIDRLRKDREIPYILFKGSVLNSETDITAYLKRNRVSALWEVEEKIKNSGPKPTLTF
jgi:hypothetical protein